MVLQPCPHRCSRGGERCPATPSWRGWPQQHIHHLATSFWIYKVWHDRDRDGLVQSTRRKEDGGLCGLSIAWGPGQDCQVVFSFPWVSEGILCISGTLTVRGKFYPNLFQVGRPRQLNHSCRGGPAQGFKENISTLSRISFGCLWSLGFSCWQRGRRATDQRPKCVQVRQSILSG